MTATATADVSSGGNAFCEAVDGGDASIVEILVKAVDNINAVCEGRSGRTPLSIATYYERDEIVQILLDAGADADAKNVSGNTALCAAVYLGRIETTEILVNGGADVHAVCEGGPSSGRTPLNTATYYGRDEIVQILIGRRSYAVVAR